MIDRIVPEWIVAAETREDLIAVELFASEQDSLGEPVEKRRNEFITARACVRRALAQLDLPPSPVPNGERGQPVWPDGVVGSITHCAGYRACALAHADDATTIGIDAEPIFITGFTDASIYNNVGIEMAVVGIGAKDEHSTDESIAVADMERALTALGEMPRLSAE